MEHFDFCKIGESTLVSWVFIPVGAQKRQLTIVFSAATMRAYLESASFFSRSEANKDKKRKKKKLTFVDPASANASLADAESIAEGISPNNVPPSLSIVNDRYQPPRRKTTQQHPHPE